MRSRRTPSTPRVAPVHLEGLVPADPDGLDAGVLLEGVRLADADLPPVNLAGAELAEVEVARVSADDVDLIGARLREVSLAEVRFAALRAARADWRDSQLSGRVGLLDAHEGEWRSVILTGCKIDFLSLRGARVEDVLSTTNDPSFLNLSTRAVSSTINLAPGQTALLGGLMQNQFTMTKRRVPVLGAIPIIGELFGSTVSEDETTDLLLIVTAQVID